MTDSHPSLQPIIYNDINRLFTSILSDYNGGDMLVAGHSPTAPHIVAVLDDSQRVCLVNPNELDSLCIVTVCDCGRSKVVNLQYGGQVFDNIIRSYLSGQLLEKRLYARDRYRRNKAD